ncbi:ATP-dependent DNA helicase PcrA [Plesiocystis pacifica SIR-1]|uniref:DNA 3'-5' helicase n=1 Tax=Plesiocystis pacifica SIR-1 TaxID=391625 RepID=A6GB18_9BACT|nr:UvrD-helicase domain-containing protein [Plesiocystis pacifica]EDM76900.1 ATP-dependent DNA helicase PcrA [Plesiocystis pacifica SIR-1]
MAPSIPLNPAQRAGVEYRGGPLLLLAGAGTGKTRVITQRVAALIDEGVPAWRILAVTFTNKAAGEMRERIAGLLEMELDELRRDGPWIGTFHSICARILRRHGQGVGLTRNFSIYDADDQKTLMRRVLKDLDIDPKAFSASAALGKIDAAKNLGYARHQLDAMNYSEPVASWTRKAWTLYEGRLRAADAVDFNDLLALAVELLRKAKPAQPQPGARSFGSGSGSGSGSGARRMALRTTRGPGSGAPTASGGAVNPVLGLRRRFFHVVVDEFQDTNPVQAELVELLCGPSAQLCVVGDDDQAIYGWRGADVKQILNFPDRHPGCEVIRLEQNYRSTTHILDCANAVIRGGARRHSKRLWSDLGPGERAELHGFADERDEAQYVARRVRRAIDEGESPGEIAVFYRTHAQSRPLEEAMRLAGVRYRMLGGIRFFDRREIKDLIAYLRLLTNPGSDLDCLRVINVPARRIGARTIERLSAWAISKESSLYDACGPASKHGEEAGLGRAAVKAVKGFWELVEGLRDDSEELSHHETASLVLGRTNYLESFAAEQDAETRTENLYEFRGALEEFGEEQPDVSLAEYLEQISLAAGGDEATVDAAITLMTIHSAKGLEFDRVMLTGMEERVFPHVRSLDPENPKGREALEEERRLAYVAISRARRWLSLSFVERRFLWGSTQLNEPSRFLRALPEEGIVRKGLALKQNKQRARALAPRRREPSWDDDIELDPEYRDDGSIGRVRTRSTRSARSKRTEGVQTEGGQTVLSWGGSSLSFAEPETGPYEPAEPETTVEYEAHADAEIFQGMRVRHKKYGVGIVIGWTGSGPTAKLTIGFGGTRRTIVARFVTPV